MSRLRKITNAKELIQQYDELLKQPNSKIQHGILEIGCGKGQWLIQNALSNPKIMYYGVEKDETIVLKLLRKINCLDSKPKNLLIICDDANNLINWFDKVEKIYIHFPDP
jgi:tRNA (guanine-N7-)-methyltransferase